MRMIIDTHHNGDKRQYEQNYRLQLFIDQDLKKPPVLFIGTGDNIRGKSSINAMDAVMRAFIQSSNLALAQRTELSPLLLEQMLMNAEISEKLTEVVTGLLSSPSGDPAFNIKHVALGDIVPFALSSIATIGDLTSLSSWKPDNINPRLDSAINHARAELKAYWRSIDKEREVRDYFKRAKDNFVIANITLFETQNHADYPEDFPEESYVMTHLYGVKGGRYVKEGSMLNGGILGLADFCDALDIGRAQSEEIFKHPNLFIGGTNGDMYRSQLTNALRRLNDHSSEKPMLKDRLRSMSEELINKPRKIMFGHSIKSVISDFNAINNKHPSPRI